MAFHKQYPNRKDWRSQLHHGCKNRSGCRYCELGRQHQTHLSDLSFAEQLKEWRNREQFAEEEREEEMWRNDPERHELDLIALFHPMVALHWEL